MNPIKVEMSDYQIGIYENARKVEREQERQGGARNHPSRSRSFSPGDSVYVKNFGQDASSLRWLPGVICQSFGPASYMIKLSEGQVIRRHVNHTRERTDQPSLHNDQSYRNVTPVSYFLHFSRT